MADARRNRIGDAFGAAADSYDAHADVQRTAAVVVADLAVQAAMLANIGPRPHILELGCGTGLLTREIARRWPEAPLVATDLSPAMVAKARSDPFTAATFLTMDAEAPVYADGHFDLILSNLAFQWFADIRGALARLHRLLRPGGSLIFSTMAARSFAQWRAAHEACGQMAGIPAYPTLDAVRAMLADYPDGFAFDEDYAVPASGAAGLLAHLKGIGAVVPVEGRAPLGPARLRQVMRRFDAMGGGDAYHVAFGRIRRL